MLAFGWCEGLQEGQKAQGNQGDGVIVGHGGILCCVDKDTVAHSMRNVKGKNSVRRIFWRFGTLGTLSKFRAGLIFLPILPSQKLACDVLVQ